MSAPGCFLRFLIYISYYPGAWNTPVSILAVSAFVGNSVHALRYEVSGKTDGQHINT